MSAVTAGASQDVEARRARALAEEYLRLAAQQQRIVRRHEAGGAGERKIGALLQPMSSSGWTLLADRRWPGTRAANVDLLHVGPGGVLVVDVKNWREVHVEDGRLCRGQEDAHDDVDKVLRIAELAEQTVAEVGLAPLEVVPVLVFVGKAFGPLTLGRITVMGEKHLVPWINRRGERLDAEKLPEVLAVLERDFPPHEDAGPVEVSPVVVPPVLPLQAVEEHPEQQALFSAQELEASLLDGALAAPIEDWMAFLHPSQAKLVRQSRNGPARVRGPAGTGKTVIGLHRAAYLAGTRPGRLLYVSFVRTLPTVLAATFARLAPQHVERVEFRGLHSWARRFLTERGVRHRVDLKAADTCFWRSWASVGRYSALAEVPVPVQYWKEEIASVIKGRGLTDFSEYADLTRVGRSTPLNRAQREAVWQLHAHYCELLRSRELHDAADLLLLALAEVLRRPLDEPYVAVVVDEVQDLSRVGVQLLHALGGDGPDGLLLIGDGQQAVYPGGFTLSEAGINVRGRSTVLETNYRNASRILEAAVAVVASDAFGDLDDSLEAGARRMEVARDGGVTVRVDAPDARSLEMALVQAVTDLAASGAGLGDCALLTATTADASRYAGVLRRAGVPLVPLEEYAGQTCGRLKVGTIKRAKGLEFKHVFLPGLREGGSAAKPGESETAWRERLEVERRELYVGMTRARDSLWLGFLQ
ncbi:NERD domain-containing protein [Paenibacillus sp. TRM 82003]|uniref:nuclease-related domain-containing DEAD/DEAH box helicase n=1 Tax=Kineococcus sp. TRM81007 TaxID=2925831 RepID=UPI001F56670B|nr:3'-5' exonuclease [Kineococcus sp. TRM81007]MCI2237070.1 NERD domain-containing protein [Kineococcus sp. TRM81007]MCI3926463.1 NERD domain-containing protein [Paenibacillus sp. TRM 82003]